MELEILSRSLGVEKDVIFTGLLEDVAACYTALDVFVLSSLTEQMPMSLLEAMACGLPAICTDVGDCAEVLGNPGLPAVVPSGDVAGIRGIDARVRAGIRCSGSRPAPETGGFCAARFSAEQMVSNTPALYRAAAIRTSCKPASNTHL